LEIDTAGVTWSDITSIVHVYGTSSTTFTCEGVYLDSIPKVTPITGSITHFDVGGCDFSYECSSNQFAKDLSILFNTLHLGGDILSGTDVELNPYITGTDTIPGLITAY